MSIKISNECEKRILELLASPGDWDNPALISRDDLLALFVSYGDALDELEEDEGVINVWRRRCVEAEEKVDSLNAARYAYASEFPVNGEPDIGSIHENIRKLKSDSAEYVKRTDAQIEHLSNQINKAKIAGLSEGFAIAQEHVYIGEREGFYFGKPALVWGPAELKLECAIKSINDNSKQISHLSKFDALDIADDIVYDKNTDNDG